MAKYDKVANKYYKKKYLETSTAEVLVYNPATKQEIFMNEMESDELAQSCDEEKIKAGIDNHTVTVLNKNKEITFKATEVVSRMEMQLAKLQATMKTGSVTAMQFPTTKTVKGEASTLKITLDETPLYSDEIQIYDAKGALVESTNYTVSGKEITFTKGVVANDQVTVGGYQFTTSCDYADLGTESIPSVVSVYVKKPLFDTNDTIVAYKQYFFPKCKMDSNVTLTGNTEKAKQTEETTFTVMKDDNYEFLGRIMFLEVNKVQA